MPLVSLKKHYKIGLSVFACIALLGLPLAWLKGKSFYSATAVVYVAPRFANILKDSKEQDIPSYQQYQQFLAQQMGTVARYDIVLTALQKMGDRRFVWQNPGESERRAAERLQAALSVAAIKNTYLFSVTLESEKKDYLDEIINTVIAVYFSEAQHDQILYASQKRLDILYGQRSKLQEIIASKKKRVAEITQELSVTTFVDSSANPYDLLLADSQRAYSEAQRGRMAAEAGLLLFENPKDSKATSALESTVSDIVYKDQGLFSLKANMYQRRSKLVEQISGLDPKHPWHEQIKKQLAVIEAEVVAATTQLSNDVRHMLLEERRSKVTLARKIELDLLNQVTEQKQKAYWFSGLYNEALTLNQDIKRFYSQMESVEDRIAFIELESQAPGFIRMESAARPPEAPIRGGRKKIIVMVAMAGALLGLLIPIIIDLLDKRIKTAGQVEKLLGYKPLASLLEAGQANVSVAVVADQKRRLALALERERFRAGRASSVILLTSVAHDSTVTSLAFDLALDYQKTGTASIVVEINPLQTDARYGGNSGLMAAAQDPVAAIARTDGHAPDRISLGSCPDAALSDYPRLQAVLEKLAGLYRVVIIDTAPILLSADVEFLASVSDITLLLIAAQKTQPGEIRRAVKLLERIDPKAVGFIVTRLQLFSGGGYYSKVYSENLKG